MGRLKKNTSKEILAERQRLYSKKYYWKNKEKIDARVRENNRRKKSALSVHKNKS